jgi:uncharacterized protein YdhG (YjbR/CyaY superfamily)
MTAKKDPISAIDAYIKRHPRDVQKVLKDLRSLIQKMAPGAEEVISYGVPAFKKKGIVIFFAAFKGHIGIYPPVRGDAKLVRDLKAYAGPKGNLKFSLDEPMPMGLIKRVVKYHIKREAEGSAKE